ncbi:MAG: PPC domain-containing protein [Chloroflexi bacterium]|nr:PPC domain-containing protein [Chloroflexota bacterium]
MKRLLMLVVVLSLVVMPGLIAAQGDEFVCNLDEADCELLENTLTAMAGVQTVNADTFDFGFTLETGSTTDSINFVGAGPLDFSGVEGVELDFTLDEFTTETDNFPLESGATALRIVDGMTYTFDGETWTSYTSDTVGLTELYSPANLLALAVGASDAVAWERGEDIEVDGRALYVYTADIQFGDILALEEFTDLLDSQLESGEIPEAEGVPIEMIGLVLGVLGTQLNEGTSRITFHISPEDNLIYGTVVDIDVAIDFAELLGAFGGGDAGELPRLATDFDLTMTLSGYGEAVQIEAPEDAVEGDPISLAEALVGGLTSGMDVGGGGVDFGGGSDFDPGAVEAELVPGEEATGVLTVENDSQFYRFTASQGDVITITMYALNEDSDLDTYLRLLDAEGNRLAENDDAEDNPQLGFFDSEIKSFEIPADGDYFVEATWLFTSPDGEYGLVLAFEE